VPVFTVLSRVDAYVDYITEIEADTPEEAVDLIYMGAVDVTWEKSGVVEFDAVHIVALDDDGGEIESTARGKG